jgi:hypothetical protein
VLPLFCEDRFARGLRLVLESIWGKQCDLLFIDPWQILFQTSETLPEECDLLYTCTVKRSRFVDFIKLLDEK